MRDHRKKEQAEAHLYMTIQILLESDFKGHQGADLFDPEFAKFRKFRVKKTTIFKDFLDQLSKELMYPLEQMRPWPFDYRSNQTYRPMMINIEQALHRQVRELAMYQNLWNIFLETVPLNSGLTSLPLFDRCEDFLLFFKLYDPKQEKISYCGHQYLPAYQKLGYLIPILNEKAGFRINTKLRIYQEKEPFIIERIFDLFKPLEEVFEDLMDGYIFIFQKKEHPALEAEYKLKKPVEYFKSLSE